ncbi:Zinc finger DHHC-type palmitoyltransferase protein [Neofusicoccum parvum]|nr:Zinc finger DHHC-type palmitoyltransferase protein [Neofusicoccum parvum]
MGIKNFLPRRFTDVPAEKSEDLGEEPSAAELQEEWDRNHTVPIKPDPPDDDEPPYTKAERKDIQLGKSHLKPPPSKRKSMKLERFRLKRHTQETVEEDEMSTELKESSFSDSKRPSSRDLDEAAVTSGSEDDEDETEGSTAIKYEPQPPTRTFSDRTDKHPLKRTFTLTGLKKRVPSFRRSISHKMLANTSSPAKSHDEDNLDPKSARPASSSTTPAPSSPSHHRIFSWHFPSFHPAGHNAHLSTRSARERLIDTPEKWLALTHRTWPALFTNFPPLAAYMAQPGPSDQLARLIEGTAPPPADDAPEDLRKAALGTLELVYAMWLDGGDGAVRDYGRSRGWRLESGLPRERGLELARPHADAGAGRGRGGKEERVDSATDEGGGGRRKKRFEGVRGRVERGVKRVKSLGRRDSGE